MGAGRHWGPKRWLNLLHGSMLVSPAGFEPTAPRLGIWCSIQLSYGDTPPSYTRLPPRRPSPRITPGPPAPRSDTPDRCIPAWTDAPARPGDPPAPHPPHPAGRTARPGSPPTALPSVAHRYTR